MSVEELDALFMDVPEIMRDSGQDNSTVHNWVKYHGYMEFRYFKGKPLVSREAYSRFKEEHPELIKSQVAA